MVIKILKNQWVVVDGIEPLLWTASNYREVCERKFRNRYPDKGKFQLGSNSQFKLANVSIEVTDLNLND